MTGKISESCYLGTITAGGIPGSTDFENWLETFYQSLTDMYVYDAIFTKSQIWSARIFKYSNTYGSVLLQGYFRDYFWVYVRDGDGWNVRKLYLQT